MTSPYPVSAAVVGHELDVAHWVGVEEGWAAGFDAGDAAGWAAGWLAGFATGLLLPDPPPEGSPARRALERHVVREALWPTAETLADAVAAHLRDVERVRARGAGAHHNGDYGVPQNGHDDALIPQNVLGRGGRS